MGAVRHFYEKLMLLPLDEKAPGLYSHYLITYSTLERVGDEHYHTRAEKNRIILQDVTETVQRTPDMLKIFCNVLQDFHVAAKLAQEIKGINYNALSWVLYLN